MLEQKIAAARGISLEINTLEQRGTAQIKRSLALASSIIATREAHGMSETFASGAVSEAAGAAALFAEGAHRLANCHRHLADDQIEFGVPRMGGDDRPCPTWRDYMRVEERPTAQRHLRAVG